MRLGAILAEAGVTPDRLTGDGEIQAITIDSRRVTPGALFVCMPGMRQDSQSFLADARARGAAAALVYDEAGMTTASAHALPAAEIPPERFPDAVWRICDTFFAHPTRSMKLIGVTGTNGKTTTAWLIRDMLAALGEAAGYLGTLGFELPGERWDLPNTTPFAVDLYNYLAKAVSLDVQAMAMEVSSHALAQHRVDGLEFDAAIFTNLTQDHLDFHGSMENYAAAKARLFRELPALSTKPFCATYNVDDPVGQSWAAMDPSGLTYSARRTADVWADDVTIEVDRIEMTLRFGDVEDRFRVRSALGGSYNLENLLAAASGMIALGYRPSEVADAMQKVRPVPGRFEAIPNERGVGVLVDYAHTPDALEKVLAAARPLTRGKLITVFGCGGDRDRTKRPLMGRAASERSDLTILTSDNPRTEDPEAILDDIEAGLVPDAPFRRMVDRPSAIHFAISTAEPGDVVVLAGKGHENYQVIGHEKIAMDDRDLARAALGVGQ